MRESERLVENTRRCDTMILDASALSFSQLNEAVRRCGGTCRIRGCLGQRFLGAGLDAGEIAVEGVPGNALGAYLNGAAIRVEGNAQDAVGDTMNDGTIAVDGRVGDAAGYAMRGGAIYVRGDAGYRAGVHMKAYGEKRPVLVIGGPGRELSGRVPGRRTHRCAGAGRRPGTHCGKLPLYGHARRRGVFARGLPGGGASRRRSPPAWPRRRMWSGCGRRWRHSAACSAQTRRTSLPVPSPW